MIFLIGFFYQPTSSAGPIRVRHFSLIFEELFVSGNNERKNRLGQCHEIFDNKFSSGSICGKMIHFLFFIYFFG